MTIQQIIASVRGTHKVLARQHLDAKLIEKQFKQLAKTAPATCKK